MTNHPPCDHGCDAEGHYCGHCLDVMAAQTERETVTKIAAWIAAGLEGQGPTGRRWVDGILRGDWRAKP